MDGRCAKHTFEPAENTCRNCGIEFCAECLVYAFGPKKPPLCVSCALAKSGVRSNAAHRPVRSRREIRRIERQRRKDAKAKDKESDTTVEVEVEAFSWSARPDPDESSHPEPAVEPFVEDEEDSPFAWADRADRANRAGKRDQSRLDAF